MEQIATEILNDLADFSLTLHAIDQIRSFITETHLELLQQIIDENIENTDPNSNDNLEDPMINCLNILQEEINYCDKISNI